MLRKNKAKLIATSLLILLPVVVGLLLWNRLPEQVATHWGANGEVNGWSSRAFAVFGLPLFLLAMQWVCVLATLADPRNKNIGGKVLGLVLWIIPVVSLVCNFFIYGTALEMVLDVGLICTLLIGVMFIVIGNYLPKCKRNYTVGIKLPWTIHDEENWNSTHRFGGKVWTAGGVIILLTAVLNQPMILTAILILLIALPTLYSFILYRKARS